MIRATQKIGEIYVEAVEEHVQIFLSRVWDKEKYNSESSRGIKRQTFGIRALMLYH